MSASPRRSLPHSFREFSLVSDVLLGATESRISRRWTDALELVEREFAEVCKALESGDLDAYGTTRLVGHWDHVSVNAGSRLQESIIRSHGDAAGPWTQTTFGMRYLSRLALSVKLSQWACGGSGVSPDLYRWVIAALESGFLLEAIRSDVSYSCGDVVPAAQIASEVIEEFGSWTELGPSDALAFINGDFLQIAVTIHLADRVEALWGLLEFVSTVGLLTLDSAILLLDRQIGAGEPKIEAIRSNLTRLAPRGESNRAPVGSEQLPVSIRSIPEQVSIYESRIKSALRSAEISLERASANPLFHFLDGRALAVSNASFLNFEVANEVSSLVDLLLQLGSSSERRCHRWVASLDNPESFIRLVQFPKVATAWAERLRVLSQWRPCSVAQENSEGVEDLWLSSLEGARIAEEMVELVARIMAREASIYFEIEPSAAERISIELGTPTGDLRKLGLAEREEVIFWNSMELADS